MLGDAGGSFQQVNNFNVPVQTPDEFAKTMRLYATYGLEGVDLMETSRANVLIHRSDGQTFAMDDKPIGLLELKGVDAPAMEVFTEKKRRGATATDGDGQPRGGKGHHHPGQIARRHQITPFCAPGRWCFLIRNSPTTWISATTV